GQQPPVAFLGPAAEAERMTPVAATPHGFVAGGSVGPELFDRHARFWTSPDGAAWTPVADDPQGFDDAEPHAIAVTGQRLVAVGVVGSAQRPTAGVSWTSDDGGETWTRHDDPA